MAIDAARLASSAQRLFPDRDMDAVMVELLLEKAQKNLVKYRVMAHQLQAKYDADFDAFRERVLASQPAYEVEQDYFDWELAVTGISDMEAEIELLRHLRDQAT